jgi:hypothetical protein
MSEKPVSSVNDRHAIDEGVPATPNATEVVVLSDGDDSPIAATGPPPTDPSSPLQDGLDLMEWYVATLPWKELQPVVEGKSKAFINAFYTHFRELKKDSKTKDGTAATCPRTCKVTFPFQAVERFRGSAAHTAFEAKTSSAINQCRTILGELWAEGLSHNHNARKEDLLEMLIKALPDLAEIFLTLAGPTEYESHDLVADFSG